jgi:hypothetical protein
MDSFDQISSILGGGRVKRCEAPRLCLKASACTAFQGRTGPRFGQFDARRLCGVGTSPPGPSILYCVPGYQAYEDRILKQSYTEHIVDTSVPFLLFSFFFRNIGSRYPQPEAQCQATTTVHARRIETREVICLAQAQADTLVRPTVVFVPLHFID